MPGEPSRWALPTQPEKTVHYLHNGTLERKLKEYVRPQLLPLDKLGHIPIDNRRADLMFQVMASPYETGSIVISTNRVFKDWGQIFDVANTLATDIIDRLMHHGEEIQIHGESYRTPFDETGNAARGD